MVSKVDSTVIVRARRPGPLIPPTINVPGERFRIMQNELTVGEARRLSPSFLLSIRGRSGEALTDVSLRQAMELAKELSERTGKRWRVPIDKQLLGAFISVGNELTGKNWEWTRTIDFFDVRYILRKNGRSDHIVAHAEDAKKNFSVRFVTAK